MDNASIKWPLIFGPHPERDYSHQINNPQFDKMEQPISIFEFEERVKERNLKYEFKTLRMLTEQESHLISQVGSEPEYKHLNRYNDMLPFQHTLVKIKGVPHEVSVDTYINANYITTVFNDHQAIIAAQGPLQQSVSHFWNMVWHNNVNLVVMLCQLQDKRGVQCHKYWPDAQDKMGDLTVHNRKIEQIGDKLFQTTLEVQNGQECRLVKHIQWSGWPDFGTPQLQNMGELDTMIKLMSDTIKQNKKAVVHCSAGVGRTGTLISCYQIQSILNFYKTYIEGELQRGNQDFKKDNRLGLSIFSLVRRQREQRVCLVMNQEQYDFVYSFALNKVAQLLKSLKL